MKISLAALFALVGIAASGNVEHVRFRRAPQQSGDSDARLFGNLGGLFNNNNNNNNNIGGGLFNNNIPSAVGGLAFGAGIQALTNQIFNPCTGNNRGNSNTNTRFLNQNQQTFALSAIAGFTGAQAVNNALGNPCG